MRFAPPIATFIAGVALRGSLPWRACRGGRTPYLYKTTDYGNTWQRITNGIGKHDYSWVIREDPVWQGLLYAGTESGAYVSFDAGESWQSLQQNLPYHGVFDTSNHLRATTAGPAGLNVNIEHPFQSLSPGHCHMTLRGCFLILISGNFPVTLAPPGRSYPHYGRGWVWLPLRP